MIIKPQATHQNRLGNDDNLIPLINVVFLMLIFFMVAGQIQMSDPANIQLPESSTQTPMAEQRHELLIDADGTGYLDGIAVKNSALSEQLTHLTGQTEQQAALLIKADATLPVSALRDYLKRVHASGFSRVSLATQQSAGVQP